MNLRDDINYIWNDQKKKKGVTQSEQLPSKLWS